MKIADYIYQRTSGAEAPNSFYYTTMRQLPKAEPKQVWGQRLAILRLITMKTKQLFSIAKLSRLLDVSPTAVSKWLAEGIIEQPEYSGGGALLFSQEQVARIKEVVAKRRGDLPEVR